MHKTIGAVAMCLVLHGTSSVASADPAGGTVTGTVQLAAGRGGPPERNQGFVDRAPSQLRPPRRHNPFPEIIVVLTGGVAAAADREAPNAPVTYTLIGESFDPPILPIVTGGKVELKNASKTSPRLYSPSNDSILKGGPVNPKGKRLLKDLGTAPYEVVEIRSYESAHLSGRIVLLPHKYYSRVDASGKFSISGVPAGLWKIKVWSGIGWIDMTPISVKVPARKSAKPKIVALPAKIKIKPPETAK